MSIAITPFLRKVLYLDAVMSGAAAILCIAGASVLAPFTGLPEGLLFWTGIVLVPFVAMLLALAIRPSAPKLMLVDIAALNALWVAASFGLLSSGLVEPNLFGSAFVITQALAVALFAILQVAGLRSASVQSA
jgi:hypothetical protein